MRFFDLPAWAQRTLSLRKQKHETGQWEKRDEGYYSRTVHIAYPAPGGVHYVVDRLEAEGWKELDGMHFIPETAYASAQKRAYNDEVPHRVREVVWDG